MAQILNDIVKLKEEQGMNERYTITQPLHEYYANRVKVGFRDIGYSRLSAIVSG